MEESWILLEERTERPMAEKESKEDWKREIIINKDTPAGTKSVLRRIKRE